MNTRVFSLNKREIKECPLQLIYEDGVDGVNQRKSFAKYSSWLLPQALALLGNSKAIKNSEGKYDGGLTARNFVSSSEVGSDWAKGLLFYLISSPRGTIFPVGLKATSGELLPYAALVPLFLAGFKKYQNINYNEWDNLQGVIDRDLFLAMYSNAPHFTTEELIELRLAGSTIKTGDKAGTVKNPTSVTTITSTGFPEFDSLPRLAKLMLTQCWVAHPTFRHKYMVLDPNNWDNIPTSLIDTDVVKSTSNKLPWED